MQDSRREPARVAGIGQRYALDQFLKSVQRRAFQIARVSLQHDEDALDAVQESMLKLVQHYSDKPETEWPALFYRILQSRIMDTHRRNRVKNRLFGWLGFGTDEHTDEEVDPFSQVADTAGLNPEQELDRQQSAARLVTALEGLPIRQQQAFLLRVWEGLSTTETATAMAVTEGSVKTHLSRAMASMKPYLEEHHERT
jgi:RNA polymerase sigma-70 factor (ECF subfamily)